MEHIISEFRIRNKHRVTTGVPDLDFLLIWPKAHNEADKNAEKPNPDLL